jgi:zinc protease
MKQKFLLLAAFIIILCSKSPGQAKLVEKITKNGSELVIPYEKYVLPNGLTLIVHEDHSDPVVHVDVTYHVGSAREQIGKSGFAHFFEHMMFMGSENAPEKLHDHITIGSGGTNNGSTNRDRTNYYETVPKNALEPTLWLEADRMGFLLDAVTQPKFEIQRSTVKNERGQNYDNRPYGLAFENISKNLYPYGHPYSWITIGYIEDLNRSEVNDLKNFFLRWYSPNNATLTIGGDVKSAEVVKLVEKYFGSIPRGPEVKRVNVAPVKLESNRYASYVDNYARLPRLQVVYPTVPNYHKDMPALACLAQILGQGKASLLYQNLVKNQLALQATASSQLSELAGEFSFDILPVTGKSLVEMENLLKSTLDEFEKRGATDEDVAKFKGGIESNIINGLQSVFGKVSQLANFQTFTGNPNKIADILKMYSSLTKEDVMNAYNTYIKGKSAVVLSVVPKGQESLIAHADNFKIDSSNYTPPDYGYAGLKYAKAKDNFDRKKQPPFAAVPMITVPKFWKKELTNGAKVIGAENTEIPTITFTITIPGGHLASANDLSKVGLASFFAKMMNEDTKSYSAEQFSIELLKLGSSVNVSSGIDGITYSVQSLKKNFDKTMTLLEERMFHPNFTEDAFNRIKKQSLESFKLQKSQPASVATAVFMKLTYGNNILGISQDGTEESVKNISLDDIKNYYSNYMTSQDAKVVIVGDIKEAEALSKLSFLDKLSKKKITLPKTGESPSVDRTKVYLVDIPKAAQSEFRIGYATGLKYDATGDYYKAYLMNYPLGTDFTSRLNQMLRETKGWTYGAGSFFAGDKYSGRFQFSSGIRADATDSALTEVMRQFRNYIENGPTEDEVDFMKTAVGQGDALNYETAFQKAAFIRRVLDYNLRADFVAQQNKILKNMNSTQMKAVASKYLQPDKMNILLVGDKAKILKGLQKLGYPIIELDADGKPLEKKGF